MARELRDRYADMSDVLADLLPKVAVQCGDTAGEVVPLVTGRRFDDIGACHLEAVTSLRRRSMARSLAGTSGGGLRMASTKAR